MPGTRWLTFDCYGTIADWNTCMLGVLDPVAGARLELLQRLHDQLHGSQLVVHAQHLPEYPLVPVERP